MLHTKREMFSPAVQIMYSNCFIFLINRKLDFNGTAVHLKHDFEITNKPIHPKVYFLLKPELLCD